MSINDELGTRMKTFYEEIPKTKLVRRMPVAIRIDGKSFHTFTRGFNKPFDEVLMRSMQDTMKYLCEHIQGCVLGYTQSDEITLILIDYQNLNSSAWFDYEIQKLCSVSASMATLAFNRSFEINMNQQIWLDKTSMTPQSMDLQMKMKEYHDTLRTANHIGAMFDSRCFNIPKEEVANLIYWRQLDATRNSIQMVGQANFSHKELQGKSCNEIQDMLMTLKGINWNDFATDKKRGSCCIKMSFYENGVERSEWVIDRDIPIFKGGNRRYIGERILIG